jgi:hypothetical protein
MPQENVGDTPVGVLWFFKMASRFRLRLIDTAGGVIGIVSWDSETVSEGDTVLLPDGRPVEVIEVYDDEYGQEGGVQATVVVDDE